MHQSATRSVPGQARSFFPGGRVGGFLDIALARRVAALHDYCGRASGTTAAEPDSPSPLDAPGFYRSLFESHRRHRNDYLGTWRITEITRAKGHGVRGHALHRPGNSIAIC